MVEANAATNFALGPLTFAYRNFRTKSRCNLLQMVSTVGVSFTMAVLKVGFTALWFEEDAHESEVVVDEILQFFQPLFLERRDAHDGPIVGRHGLACWICSSVAMSILLMATTAFS